MKQSSLCCPVRPFGPFNQSGGLCREIIEGLKNCVHCMHCHCVLYRVFLRSFLAFKLIIIILITIIMELEGRKRQAKLLFFWFLCLCRQKWNFFGRKGENERKKAHGHKNNPFSIPSSFHALQKEKFFHCWDKKNERFSFFSCEKKEEIVKIWPGEL